MPLWGPVAVELWRVDEALAGVRTREARLLGRRDELLGILRDERERPEAGVGPGAGGTAGARPGASAGPYPVGAGPYPVVGEAGREVSAG
ncbi:hypothetical protein, partial [Sphaerisporangium aureirubrum]